MRNTDSNRSRIARATLAVAATAALGLGVAACGSSDSSGSSDSTGPQSGEVALVGYSTPTDAYENVLEPGFQATEEGADVTFKNSFGASGDQSRAVESGQPADIVHFALAPDVERLVDAGLVDDDWDDGEYKGTFQESVVAFTVRGGNPKNIQDWDDLIRDDVDVLVPNPFTSGGARWDIMAAYGQAIESGATDEEALEFVKKLLENVTTQDASASDALETFTAGEGDVLISYESEALRAQDAGEDVDYVVPDSTIKIETKGAVLNDDTALNPGAAQAFEDYLLSPEGQQGFADEGFRPVDPDVLKENEDKFPTPKNLFTIDDLGGWDQVTDEFFGEDDGKITVIEQDLGVPTA
ncbi:MAG: sulfate ABC transporter substrate-binding protein [Solirubrobacterales bacterium]